MEKRRLASITLIGGLVIFAIKYWAYLISGSVALLSDALESIVNIFASFMMYISIGISDKPPDDSHHYGHEKVENLSCLIEGLLIIIAGGMIWKEAISRIYTPITLSQVNLAVVISLAATSMNGGLSWLLMSKASKLNSLALEGDAKHLFSDVVSSIGVSVGLLVSKWTGFLYLDSIIAVIVGIFVIRMGTLLLLKAINDLLDQSCPEEEEKIKEVMDRHKAHFVDYHNLKTRRSGGKVFAELHLSLDESLTVHEAHVFTDHLQEDINEISPEIELIIHIDPRPLS
jgi:cation diffusion facilitator family transporter